MAMAGWILMAASGSLVAYALFFYVVGVRYLNRMTESGPVPNWLVAIVGTVLLLVTALIGGSFFAIGFMVARRLWIEPEDIGLIVHLTRIQPRRDKSDKVFSARGC